MCQYVPLTSYGFLQSLPLPTTPLPIGLSSPRSGDGTRQTGDVQLKIASLVRDQHWLPVVQVAAREVVARHPERAVLLTERWLKRVEGTTATRFFQS